MKRLCFGIVVLLVMMLSSVAYAETNIQIGDYMQMGTYYDEPILWRCVAFEKISGYDENGNPIIDSTDTVTEYQEGYLPLMLSDKIICLKPFDGKGIVNMSYGSHKNRGKNCSNYWGDSNMRSWLNSSESAGNVHWICGCPPTDVYHNAYNKEAGFLTNFTDEELAVIRTVTQKSFLSNYDNSLATMGTEVLANYGDINCIDLNYNDAYAEYVTDTMFLVDIRQANEIYKNSNILGEDYYIGEPTVKAIENSSYKNGTLAYNYYWYYWLRTFWYNNYYVGYVKKDGSFGAYEAYDGTIGVRPAFHLNLTCKDNFYGIGTSSLPLTARQYTYKFIDEDGTILKEATVEYGTKIEPPANNPIKPNTVQYTYKFNGWDNYTRRMVITNDVVFTANYTATVNEYTYRFIDEDGTVLKEVTADYGTKIEPPEEPPVKQSTEQYQYIFKDWTGYESGMTLNSDVDFFARYVPKYKELKDIQIGDYLQMGTYLGEPILWRCVAFEKIDWYRDGIIPVMDSTDTITEYKDGYLPLMISDKILCIKEFDAAGSFTDNSPFHHTSSHDRGYADRKLDASGNRYYWAMDRHKNGSNYWGDSNIRAWLNSTALNVTYPCVVYPSYSSEAGFLSNFTLLERKSIKTIQQKSFLDAYEYSTTTPNENAYGCGSSIENVVGNYSTDFYELVESSMFLIDTKQLHTIYQNRNILGDDYYIGEPTEKCIEVYSPSLSDNKYSYLLRTPAKIYYQSSGVDVMRKYGDIVFTTAGSTSDSGIRPAFYLPNGSTKYMSGTGEKESPYVVEQTYTYKFVDDDGTVLKEEVDISGSEITPPEVAPSKASNERYSYTFENWNGYTEGMRLTEDVIFKANYTTEVNQYTYKFLNDDGTVIKEATEDYGVTIEPPKETPIKTDDVIYKYHTFRGWKNYTQDMILTEDITFIAEYDKMNTEQATVIGDYENKLFVEYGVIDNNAVFTIKALNENDLPKLQMFIAEYNGNGTLKNIKLGTDTIQEGSLFITGDLPHSDNYKIMIWDKNQMPVINTITQINIT